MLEHFVLVHAGSGRALYAHPSLAAAKAQLAAEFSPGHVVIERRWL